MFVHKFKIELSINYTNLSALMSEDAGRTEIETNLMELACMCVCTCVVCAHTLMFVTILNTGGPVMKTQS